MQDFMDFSEEAVSYELADTGIYELIIDDAEIKKTENNKNYIGLIVAIREDVEQPFVGAKIWDNIWENEVYRNPQLNNKRIKKDDYEAMSPAQKQNIIVRMEYDDYKIRMLVHAQNADKYLKDADGKDTDTPNPEYKIKFGSIDEIAQFLNGMPFQAKILKYTDDKTGKERNSIDYKTIKRTSVQPAQETNVVVDDNDLPF